MKLQNNFKAIFNKIPFLGFCLPYINVNSSTNGGIINLAINIFYFKNAEQNIAKIRRENRFVLLNHHQRTNLNSLACRLGVTRKIEFAWSDKKTKNQEISDQNSLEVIGASWPCHNPAIIFIHSKKVLKDLNLPTFYSPSNTKILNSIAHLKIGKKDNIQKQYLFALCIHIAFIASGFFIGQRAAKISSRFEKSFLYLKMGYILGAVVSNAFLGFYTLRQVQKAEEIAVGASTAQELVPYLIDIHNTSPYQKPYWKLAFTPWIFWNDSRSVRMKKIGDMQIEKLFSFQETPLQTNS